ncbi:MAG: LysR family transcriptional regulator [Candidatus Binataceae bacterium]
MNHLNISSIDLNLFVVFEAIFAERSVTRASHRLHLTQPAVSHALGRLRETFGDPLFLRRGRAVAPTSLARKMIEPVRRALSELEASVAKVDRFDPLTMRKRFVIASGLREVFEATVLPELLHALAWKAPLIDLAIVKVSRRDLEAELATGAVDLAVDVSLPISEEIRRTPLMEGKLVVVARHGHPKVRRGLDLNTYLAQEHIMVTSRRRGQSVEEYELSRRDQRRRVRLRCQSHFAACRIVSRTDLLLTMAERYARVANAIFRNQILAFPLKTPRHDSLLYWHENADGDAANAWLRAELLSASGMSDHASGT